MRTFEASELQRVSPLGTGESGTVWLVRETATGAQYVQKRLPSAASRRELMLLARLRHPNIVALEGWGTDEAGAFLLTEVCEGPLTTVTPAEAPALLTATLRGLAFLHSRGLVHGDIKPQNLLLHSRRALVISDFGLTAATGTGDLGGTLAFMAPERLTGAPASVSSDLFAVGATFAVALGAPVPRDPRQVGESLIAWLNARPAIPHVPLLTRLLEPAPAKRPLSARAAAKELADRTGSAEAGAETPASAAAYLRPFRLLQRDDTLAALDAATRKPGVVRLRAAAGAGGSRVLAEWALQSSARLLSKSGAHEAIAQAPGLLAVDDASDADERLSARVIEQQRRAQEHEGMATIVVLVRPDDALDRALAAEFAPAIELAPLNPDTFAELVGAAFPGRGDPKPFAARLRQLCGGSPQRAFAVLSALHEQGRIAPGAFTDADPPGPEALDDLGAAPFVQGLQGILAPLLGAGSTQRRVAAVVACARRPLSLVSLASAVGGPVTDAVDRLRDLRVLAATDAIAADGEHVRAALEALLSAEEREAAHRALARALAEASSSESVDEGVSRRADVAWHRLQTHEPGSDKAAIEAARAALERSRPREVIALLRAVTLDPSARLILARALAQVGDFAEAERTAQAAAEGGADGAAVLLSEILIRRGEYIAAVSALERLKKADDLAAEALLARALALSGQHDRALQVCDAALARNPAGPPAVDFSSTAALAQFYKGDLSAAQARYTTARETAQRIGDKAREANATNGLGLVAHRRGAYDDARARYAEALKLGEEAADRARVGTSHLNLGTVLQELGRSREAAQEYRRSATVARLLGDRVQSARARSNLANLLMDVGRLEESRTVAEESRVLAESVGAGVVSGYGLLLLGELDTLQGRAREAEPRLARARELFEGMGNTAEALEAETLRARTLIVMGDAAIAETVARAVAVRAREKNLERHEAQAWLAVADALVAVSGAGDVALAAAHRAMSLGLAAKRPDVTWRLEAGLASASEKSAQSHFAARAVSGLQAAAGAIDPEDRATFLARSDRARLRQLLQGMVQPVTAPSTDQRYRRLLAINRRLGTERNLKVLLENIVDEAVELCGAERGFVLLASTKPGVSLDVLVARNIDRESLTKGAMRVSHTIAERVIKEGEPELTLDAQEDERYQAQLSVSALKLRSVLCVPLQLQGTVLGALYIDNRFRARAFGEEDLVLLQSFADQAGIALGQVRALDDARQAREEADKARTEIQSLNEKLSDRVVEQEAEIMRVRREADEQRLAVTNPFSDIVGESAPMMKMIKQLTRVANTDLTVLVTGESGTGKELVAKALVTQGPRRDRPFVSINCAALNEGLLESELFGHMRGAFTGADRDRDGLFQVANTGTLFLDEVGDMGLTMQAKLLRALQEGEIRKVGGQKAIQVNVRVIAATNRDLPLMIKEGKFREDLFYRLNVVSLHLPALRERTGDLPLLCARLLAEMQPREGKPYRLSADALALLSRHTWPGNIRELRGTLHNAALFGESDLLTAKDFASKFHPRASPNQEESIRLTLVADDMILKAVEAANGNKSEAARALGIDRKTLYNRLSKLKHMDA